ncbi:hypothetical protein AB0J43_21185, partial [Nonomuraea fuscirosea]
MEGLPGAGVPDTPAPAAGLAAPVPELGFPGVPEDGRPEVGVPEDGRPEAEVPEDGRPEGGDPGADVPEDGPPEAGVAGAGRSEEGLPDVGLPAADVPSALWTKGGGRKYEVSACAAAEPGSGAAEGESVLSAEGRPNHPGAPSSWAAAGSGSGVEAFVSGFGGVTGGRRSRVSAEFSARLAVTSLTGAEPGATT